MNTLDYSICKRRFTGQMGDDKWKFTHASGDPRDDVGFLPLVVPTKQKDKSTTHKARIVSHRMETQSLMRFHVPPQSSTECLSKPAKILIWP
ncbi:hypothetical protein CY34DRAFT_497463 [Suillus luteus UH-Slu-Lm8-n1]|uniref:Uncharacterized protein n=1 Tax=Suillus luteus UH-Slu-Lm8-n1 TaxID=930992 RepID=A0A0D0A522_9AGAM|nr:hypothetical protein CY34DRAFT_497463 [Suillus luteus UH-Slu-Lm8-n1]